MSTLLKTPSVLIKTKEAYAMWFKIFADFPKTYRYSLGNKIEESFLILLDNMFASVYLPKNQKASKLAIVIVKLDSLKFFLQLAWENKCLPSKKYAELSERLDEIGKMLGGWKRGLENKVATPPLLWQKLIRLRYDQAMTILGIPDIGILETINIHVQTVRIHVHVGNE